MKSGYTPFYKWERREELLNSVLLKQLPVDHSWNLPPREKAVCWSDSPSTSLASSSWFSGGFCAVGAERWVLLNIVILSFPFKFYFPLLTSDWGSGLGSHRPCLFLWVWSIRRDQGRVCLAYVWFRFNPKHPFIKSERIYLLWCNNYK